MFAKVSLTAELTLDRIGTDGDAAGDRKPERRENGRTGVSKRAERMRAMAEGLRRGVITR